jgi:hypothetical protein
MTISGSALYPQSADDSSSVKKVISGGHITIIFFEEQRLAACNPTESGLIP